MTAFNFPLQKTYEEFYCWFCPCLHKYDLRRVFILYNFEQVVKAMDFLIQYYHVQDHVADTCLTQLFMLPRFVKWLNVFQKFEEVWELKKKHIYVYRSLQHWDRSNLPVKSSCIVLVINKIVATYDFDSYSFIVLSSLYLSFYRMTKK